MGFSGRLPKGRRLASTSSTAGRTEYVYEGDEPIEDYTGADTLLRRYVNGASVDERLVYLEYDGTGTETTRSYYHADHQGSIIAMSKSADQTVADIYTYDAYGNMGEGQGGGQPFRYTGRRWDEETGLYYYRARYYSAKLGRFLQTDPIGYEDNMNLYGYTANDPMNFIDPGGLCAIDGQDNIVDCETTVEDGKGNAVDESKLTKDEKKILDESKQAFIDVGKKIQKNGTDEQKEAWKAITAITFIPQEYAFDVIGEDATAVNDIGKNAITVFRDFEYAVGDNDEGRNVAAHEIFHSITQERNTSLRDGRNLTNERSVDRRASKFTRKHFNKNFIAKGGYFQ